MSLGSLYFSGSPTVTLMCLLSDPLQKRFARPGLEHTANEIRCQRDLKTLPGTKLDKH